MKNTTFKLLDRIKSSNFKSLLKKSWIFFYSVIAPIATVIALSLSWWQNKDLQDISNSVSTRFVGAFPENMRSINELIGGSKDVLIITDTPSYGHFSNPYEHNLYIKRLKEITEAEGKVRVLVYNDNIRMESIKDQFSSYSLDEIKELKSYKKYIKYLERKKKRKIKHDKIEDFFQHLFDEGSEIIHELRRSGVEIKKTSEKQQIFIWIGDNSRQAVFSMLNYGPTNREVSFRTYDQKFIEILRDRAESTYDKCP